MKKGYWYIALATILFSTMEIALKLFSLGFNPMQLNFIRFMIGAALLLPLTVRNIKEKGVKLGPGDLGYFALTGLIGIVVSMTFYQLAVINTKASIVAILFSCNPVFMIPFAVIMLNEKISKSTVISMIVCFLGIIFIMNPFNMHSSALGILFTLLSAVTFAFYSVTGKLRSARYGGVTFTCASFIAGGLELLLLMLLSKIGFIRVLLIAAHLGIFANMPIFQGITLSSIPGLIYLSIFVTGLGYAFYFLAMAETNAATVSAVFFIKPALAPLLALLILKEPITVNMIGGIVLIIIGSLVPFRNYLFKLPFKK